MSQTADTKAGAERAPLSAELLQRMDAWWRAANYPSVGQIYLLDNPLLREPLRLEHIKPQLLGHWGTTPALGGGSSSAELTGSSGGNRATDSANSS